MRAIMMTVIVASRQAKAHAMQDLQDAQGNTRRAGRFQRNARRGN
jgi:hypothetical protein